MVPARPYMIYYFLSVTLLTSRPSTFPIAHFTLATLDFSLFLKGARHGFASEPLHWLFPLPRMLFLLLFQGGILLTLHLRTGLFMIICNDFIFWPVCLFSV